MAVDALKCKECSTEYPLEARYVCERCFGPLEVAYTRDPDQVDVDGLRRRIQAGPQTIWRYADFLPLEAPPQTSLPTGLTPLVRADRPKRGLGRLGIRTEGVVGEHCSPPDQVYLRLGYTPPPHSCIPRGGGTGPVKPRQPSPA